MKFGITDVARTSWSVRFDNNMHTGDTGKYGIRISWVRWKSRICQDKLEHEYSD